MTMPIAAPAMVPERETVRARYPRYAMTAFTPIAHGSCASTSAREAAIASRAIKLASHSTPAAVIGTEMLSSSRAGIVSTSAATSAAPSGAARTKTSGGGGLTAARVHHASADAPAAPHTTNAIEPAIVFSRFQGTCRPSTRWPTSVANPSPNARIPHAAATMSRREGNRRMSSSTDRG